MNTDPIADSTSAIGHTYTETCRTVSRRVMSYGNAYGVVGDGWHQNDRCWMIHFLFKKYKFERIPQTPKASVHTNRPMILINANQLI